jgi:hypothetical protein
MREVDAVAAGDGRFRLVGDMPRGKMPRFKRGEIVECEIRVLPDGKKGLVAFRSVSADPEYRKRRNIYAVCGATIGGAFGAVLGLWLFGATAVSATYGFLLGAVCFGFCSVRWGDAAWDVLVGMIGDTSQTIGRMTRWF